MNRCPLLGSVVLQALPQLLTSLESPTLGLGEPPIGIPVRYVVPVSKLLSATPSANKGLFTLLESGKSARSVQHVHAVLRQGLKHAMRWVLIFRNSAEGVDPPRPHRPAIQPPDALA